MLIRLPDAGDVAGVLREEFGLSVESMAPVIGGWDENATVWEASGSDGRRWSVKASLRDIGFGLMLASSLGDHGEAGVVAPLRTTSGASWAESGGAIITVSDWVDGVDASDLGAGAVDWTALGRTLRRIHDHEAPAASPPARRGIRRSRLSLRALIGGLDRRFEVEEVATPGGTDLRARWQSVRDRLDDLAAAERALKRRRSPTRRVTLHGDPHLGNVILDAEGAPWLIDFDESTVAPREVDLMLVELGVLFSLPVSEEQRRAFRDGYGHDVPVDEERIVRFGAVRAVEDLVWTLHRALDDDPRAPIGYDEVLDGMLGPNGQLALVEDALDRVRRAPDHDGPAPDHTAPTSKERR